MTPPQYSTYPGLGEWAKEALHYQQAVRIGNIIKISGQGGWEPEASSISIPSDLSAEIAQAFSNVDLALKAAGGEGWTQVYSVKSYHIPVDEEATAAMVKNLKEWCGMDHRPIWTEVGVSSLGAEGMRVEVEVEAWVG